MNIRIRKIWPVFVLLFTIGCRSENHDEKMQGGVAISFDDHFIEEWHRLAPLLKKHDAKTTFFLTCPNPLTDSEIIQLNNLQKQGHEIGYHGTIHGNATEMLANGNTENYLETEIRPGLGFMREAGFHPTSYAHPGGNHTDLADSILLAQGFTILRDVSMVERKLFGIPIYHIPPRFNPFIYYDFDGDPTVDALLIDVGANVGRDEIRDALIKANKDGTVLMLFGHKPLYGAPQSNEYGFEVSFLEHVIQQADSLGMRFYTMSELPALSAQRPKRASL